MEYLSYPQANQDKLQTQTFRTPGHPTSSSPPLDLMYETCNREHELSFQAYIHRSAAIRAGNEVVYENEF